jgi:hypothetical protein
MLFLLKNHLYLPLLLTCAGVTLAYVIWWMMNSGDTDPGEPNARIGA